MLTIRFAEWAVVVSRKVHKCSGRIFKKNHWPECKRDKPRCAGEIAKGEKYFMSRRAIDDHGQHYDQRARLCADCAHASI